MTAGAGGEAVGSGGGVSVVTTAVRLDAPGGITPDARQSVCVARCNHPPCVMLEVTNRDSAVSAGGCVEVGEVGGGGEGRGV